MTRITPAGDPTKKGTGVFFIERNTYAPYGVTRHHQQYDVDGDGDQDSDDEGIVRPLSGINSVPPNPTDIDETGYRSEADFDRNGVIDGDDLGHLTKTLAAPALAPGQLSEVTGTDPASCRRTARMTTESIAACGASCTPMSHIIMRARRSTNWFGRRFCS